jgi:excisionase family DNA binding protein
MEKLLVTVPEACASLGIGKTVLYELIKARKIETVKNGSRRLVVVESLRAYVNALRAAA